MTVPNFLGDSEDSSLLLSKGTTIVKKDLFYYQLYIGSSYSFLPERITLSEFDLMTILDPALYFQIKSAPVGSQISLDTDFLKALRIVGTARNLKLSRELLELESVMRIKTSEQNKKRKDVYGVLPLLSNILTDSIAGAIDSVYRLIIKNTKQKLEPIKKEKIQKELKQLGIKEPDQDDFVKAMKLMMEWPLEIIECKKALFAFINKLPQDFKRNKDKTIRELADLFRGELEEVDFFKKFDKDPFAVQKIFPTLFIKTLSKALKERNKHKIVLLFLLSTLLLIIISFVNSLYNRLNFKPSKGLVEYWNVKRLT